MTQDVTWLTIVVRYNKNGQVFSTINGAGGTDGRFAYGDRTFDAIYLVRSRTNTAHLNSDVAGAFIVDELLTKDATTVIANEMINGMDLTNTTCPSGNNCTICPTDSTSPVGTTQITSCTCNQGYTGPNGGPCTVCPVGTSKQNIGSAACIDCVAGKYSILTGRFECTDCATATYSTTVGATVATTCLGCPASSNCALELLAQPSLLAHATSGLRARTVAHARHAPPAPTKPREARPRVRLAQPGRTCQPQP
jgi:hypothetical protein